MQDKTRIIENSLLGREVIVFSSGRSGSNRILDIADLASETHCRNEPNEYCASFAPLQKSLCNELKEESKPLVLSMIAAKNRYGSRDRFSFTSKDFLKPLAGEIYRKACGHKTMRRNVLGIREPEWDIPSALWAENCKEIIVPVFKISSSLQTSKHVAAAPPSVKVIHNLRKPRDMMQSWWNRYCLELRNGDLDFLEREIISELEKCAEGRVFVSENCSRIQIERVVRANLFAWRLANEKVYMSLKDRETYTIIEYDEVSRNQSEIGDKIMSFLGVGKRPKRVTKLIVENRLFRSNHKGSLPNDLLAKAIKEIMADSPLLDLIQD